MDVSTLTSIASYLLAVVVAVATYHFKYTIGELVRRHAEHDKRHDEQDRNHARLVESIQALREHQARCVVTQDSIEARVEKLAESVEKYQDARRRERAT